MSIKRKSGKVSLRAEVDIVVESDIEVSIKRRKISAIDTNLYEDLIHHVKFESSIVDRVDNNLRPDEKNFLDDLI